MVKATVTIHRSGKLESPRGLKGIGAGIVVEGKLKVGDGQTLHAEDLNLATITALKLQAQESYKLIVAGSIASPGSPANYASISIGSLATYDGGSAVIRASASSESILFIAVGH